MRKEVILAIIIGIILGAVVLYGLKIANQTVESTKSENAAPSPTVAQTPTPTPVDFLTIDTPNDHAVVFTPTVTIKGHTKPDNAIAITSESTDDIIQSDTQGAFTTDLQLIGGENVITATIVLPNGNTLSKTLTIIYTSTAIEN